MFEKALLLLYLELLVGCSIIHGDCTDPGNIEFGSRLPPVVEDTKDAVLHVTMTLINFQCQSGYTLQGRSKMYCTSSGTWEPTQKPTCKLQPCPLPLIANGQASVINDRYYPGSRVTLVCNSGFVLKNVHNSLIECSSKGTWVSAYQSFPDELPECVEKLCWNPEHPINGTVTVHGRKNTGSYLTYQCFPGFKLSNYGVSHRVRVCRDGEWTGKSPTCEIISCYEPPKIRHGKYYSIKRHSVALDILYEPRYSVGRIVSYLCDSGYTLDGAHSIRCSIRGSWIPHILPKCKRSPISVEPFCQLPLPIEHGAYSVFGRSEIRGALTGTIIQYRCDVGYRLLGCIPGRRECKNGAWVGPEPQCVPYVGCAKPPMIAYGGLGDWDKKPHSGYQIGSRVYYMCYRGYQLTGEPQLLCRSNGCWSSRIPPSCQLQYPEGHPMSRPSDSSGSDLYDAKTISIISAGSVIGILVIILALVTLRRKFAPLGSRRIVLSSRLESDTNQNSRNQASNSHQIQDPDRLALIAFADNVQVVLPTYEEAIREHPPTLPSLGSPTCLPNRSTCDRGSYRLSRSRMSGLPPVPPYRGVRVPPPIMGEYQNLVSTRHLPGGRNSTVRSSSVSASTGDSMGSTDTMTPSEVSTTVTVETLSSNASSGASQATTASSRALCGSMTSFDTVSTANTEGAPLLEESEEGEHLEIYPPSDKYIEE